MTKSPRIEKRKNSVTRKDGTKRTWESSTYYYVYYKDKKLTWENTYEKDYDKALRWAKERNDNLRFDNLLAFLNADYWLDPLKNPLYQYYKKGLLDKNQSYEYNQSQRNARYLEIFVNQFDDPILEKPYNQIEIQDVLDMKNRMSKKTHYIDAWGKAREVTPTLRNRILDVLSTIYSFTRRYQPNKKVITNNFLEEVCGRFKLSNPKTRYVFEPDLINYMFDRDTLEQLNPSAVTTIGKTEYHLTTRSWIELLNSVYFDYFKFVAYTGLRISEASALTVEQFDKRYQYRVVLIDRAFKADISDELEENTDYSVSKVGSTKTGQSRVIVLCDKAYETVLPYLQNKKPEDYVFTTSKTDHSIKSSLYNKKQELKFRLFIDQIHSYYNNNLNISDDKVMSLHGFRTSMNTNLCKRPDVKESLVAFYLGWQSKAYTPVQGKYYTQQNVEDARIVADAINKMFCNGQALTWKPTIEEQEKRQWDNIHASLEKNVEVNKLQKNRVYEFLSYINDNFIVHEADGSTDKKLLEACKKETIKILEMDKKYYDEKLFQDYVNKFYDYLILDENFLKTIKNINKYWNINLKKK